MASQHITVIHIFRIFVSNLGKYLSSFLHMMSKISGNVCFLGQGCIFPSGSVVKNLSSNSRRHRRLWVRSPGWEDPLGEEMATHPSVLAWRIPWTEEQVAESDTTERARARLGCHPFCGDGRFFMSSLLVSLLLSPGSSRHLFLFSRW